MDSQQKALCQSINNRLSPFTIYKNAPDLLIESGLILHKILENHKTLHGEDETWKMFNKINKTINHAFNFINDIHLIYEENINLKSENHFLRNQLHLVESELTTYKSIESAILENKLELKTNVVFNKLNIEK